MSENVIKHEIILTERRVTSQSPERFYNLILFVYININRTHVFTTPRLHHTLLGYLSWEQKPWVGFYLKRMSIIKYYCNKLLLIGDLYHFHFLTWGCYII